jgi:hypothetical protein
MAKQHKSIIITGWITVFVGLYLSSIYSYLLFHSLAEGFSIVVACGVFLLAWNSRKLSDNNYLLFLGIVYLFVAILDFIHTLAYTGMGVFPGYDTNLPTQLWIAARYMESCSLLIAPVFINRRVKTELALPAYVLFSTVLLAIIFIRIFPVCFIEGVGLTPFKKISEYIISGILVSAAVVMYRKRTEFEKGVFLLVTTSIVFTIISELAFTGANF